MNGRDSGLMLLLLLLYPLCLNNILFHCQILTSVQQVWMTALNRPLVRTLMAATPAHVTLDTLEMDKSAMVSDCNAQDVRSDI